MGVRCESVQDGLEQVLGLDVPPTLHNWLKRSPAGNTEATGKKAAQPIHQHLGRGVRTTLQPPEGVGHTPSKRFSRVRQWRGFLTRAGWGRAVPLPPSRDIYPAKFRALALKVPHVQVMMSPSGLNGLH